MSKRGENIYKRKDGRWEGRYIKERSADGKARYAYVYGKSYADAKQKLLDRRIAQAQNIDCSPSHTKYGDILRNWIAMSRVHIKESTYSRYIHLANAHILPYTDADGNLIRLTCDDFACAAEFRRWKDWSDSDLRKEENADHKQSDMEIYRALAFVREQDETLSCGQDRELAELMEQVSGLLPPNVPRQRDAPEQSGMTMK